MPVKQPVSKIEAVLGKETIDFDDAACLDGRLSGGGNDDRAEPFKEPVPRVRQ
jgi:hypothetical protein